ncbi:hypothetical protein [Ferrimonas balearica]|uniref:hypothetical protein n=1 Tax=Ferrimonas balearica TaxID=44012 RepID=UPI001C99BC31|nr:hypothetical protein [Ferrimonas balearica]MBY5992514.1 hypothetical protein [Ferrimonas balearica]
MATVAQAAEIHLPVGTEFFLEKVVNSGNISSGTPGANADWVQVLDPLSIPAMGSADSEFVDVTSLTDAGPKVKATTGAARDFAITFNYVDDGSDSDNTDEGQDAIRLASENNETRWVRVAIPGIAKHLMASITFGAWNFSEFERNASIKLEVSGQINGSLEQVTAPTT